MESSEATQAQLSDSAEIRLPGRIPRCQIEGCDADLLADKRYSVRKKVCSQHMQADIVYKRDQPDQEWRFCFQCGKLEPLELFSGRQRSCRDRLVMRRKPKRSVSTLTGPHKGDAADSKRCRTAEADCSTDMHTRYSSYSAWEQQQAMWMHHQAMYGQDSWYTDQQDSHYQAWAGEQALQQPLAARAAAAAHTQAVARTASVKCEDLEAAGVQQNVLALQQQCQQLQSQLQMQMRGMTAAAPAASAPAAAAAVPSAERCAAAAAAASPAEMQVNGQLQGTASSGPAALPAAASELQRDASIGTPGSPNSAATAITTASHMQLVEMVVAQLEDPCISAEADELEAFLDRELRMAATTPRPCAKQIWASQLNDVINDLTSAITCSAVTSVHPARSSSYALRAAAAGPADGAAAGAVLGMQISADSGSQQLVCDAMPAAPEAVFDERLRSLQQQLVHLHSMVKDLRTQVFA